MPDSRGSPEEDRIAGADSGAIRSGKALRWPDARIGAGFFFLYTIYGIVSPYLQILLRGLGYSPASVGFFLGLFEITGIAGPLVVSRSVDENGRYRTSLATCSALIAIATIPLVLVHDPLVTTLSIAVFSFGLKSLIPMLDAGVTTLLERSGASKCSTGREVRKCTDAPELKFGYGLLRSMGSVGFVVVALVLQRIPRFDDSPPPVFGICIIAITCVFGASLLLIPEIDFKPVKRKKPIVPGKSAIDPVFYLGLAVIALNRLSYSSISSFFSLYVKEELGWNAVSGLWAFAAVVEIPFLILSGRFIRRWGSMKVIAFSSASTILRLAVYTLFPSPAGAVVGQFMHSVSYGLFQPAAISFVAFSFPADKRATGLALYLGLGVGLPSFLGSSAGGMIVEYLGYRALFAIFSIFAIASITVYRFNRSALGRAGAVRRAS